jgi:hypothetical protein
MLLLSAPLPDVVYGVALPFLHAAAESYNCTRLYGERSVSVELSHRAEPYHFKFDCVLPDTTTQEEVFERKQQSLLARGCNAAATCLCSWYLTSSINHRLVSSNYRGSTAALQMATAVFGWPL